MPIADFGGMAGMTHAAAQGHFAVDSATGAGLMRSLSQMIDHMNVLLRKARGLDRETPLGGLPEAQAVSDLNQLVAAGDLQSLMSVLRQFRTSLEQAHEAVRLGMANYEQVDAQMSEAYQRGLRERTGGVATGSVSA
jgi:hypothetical protein